MYTNKIMADSLYIATATILFIIWDMIPGTRRHLYIIQPKRMTSFLFLDHSRAVIHQQSGFIRWKTCRYLPLLRQTFFLSAAPYSLYIFDFVGRCYLTKSGTDCSIKRGSINQSRESNSFRGKGGKSTCEGDSRYKVLREKPLSPVKRSKEVSYSWILSEVKDIHEIKNATLNCV